MKKMFRARQPTLTKDVEEDLRLDLEPLWNRGISAKDIAKMLDFGGDGPYRKLKLYHVFYYRSKFKLTPRVTRKSGVPRYKHKPDDIVPLTSDEVHKELNKIYILDHPIKSIVRTSKMSRAFVWLLYYTPLRKSEIYERVLADFKIAETKELGSYVLIDLYRKKKIVTEKKPAIKAPFYLSLEAPHTHEIIDWLKYRMEQVNNDMEQLIFPISSWQAWNIVKKVFPKSYPHYYRFKYITDRSSNPMVPIEDLLVETDLNIITLRKYMMTGERQRRLAFMRRRERLKGEQ